MRNIIVMLGLLGGFIFLGSIDANAAECIGYNRMAGRCVTAQDRAAAPSHIGAGLRGARLITAVEMGHVVSAVRWKSGM
jgi:hypothetical protein